MIFSCLVWAAAVSLGQLTMGVPETVGDGYQFSEGPLWLPSGQWIFSDTVAKTVYSVDGKVYRADSGGSNGLALDGDSRIIACEGAARRITRLESDGSVTVLADSYEGKRLNAPNDLVVHSDGTIFFTDPMTPRKDAVSELGFSGVFSLSPAGLLTLLTDEMKYPNGIGFSPDEKTLYVSDTRGAQIRAFTLEGGKLTNSRVFCEVRIPDGMAVDEQGRIWSSSVGGISVYDSSGAPLEVIKVPTMPTNCAFGGEDGKTLLVTARKRVFKIEVVDSP